MADNYSSDEGKRILAGRIGTEPDNLEELSAEAEGIHTEVYLRVVRELGQPFEKRIVYAWKKANTNGTSPSDFPGIVIGSEIARMNERNLEYYIFKGNNESATPEDFFRITLAHEYGHQVFNEFYKASIDQVITKNLANLRSVSEASAYWFGEELTGVQHLTQNLAAKYIVEIDVRAMKFIYSQLKKASAEHGTRYVIDNFVDIVRDNISRIEDVTLVRSIKADEMAMSLFELF
jgi:hypothetical protein